jgi:N-acetyl-gamma-glutamyl-phosphate reductase
MKIDVAIIGASGYTGLELIKILVNHSVFNIKYLFVSKEDINLVDLHPSLKNILDIKVQVIDVELVNKYCDLVFLATPHTTSMQYVKKFDNKIKVVDLSADYRLSLDTYEKYYTSHIDKENLSNFVYGLPEFNRKSIKDTNFVANPGCYPTASLLGILPFVKYLDKTRDIIIDAKSGVSGAGKTPNDIKHFVSANESTLVYSPLTHRHEPEIKEQISLQGLDIHINFVPTLLPITRGMQCNIYMYINKDINVDEVLDDCYRDDKFIRIYDKPINLKNVCGSNFCDIFVSKKDNLLFVSTSIDNLLRGASSQAVVNANIMFGLEEDLDIPKISYMP